MGSVATGLAIALAIGIAGCGSDPPGTVAYETLAVDLEACAAGSSTCVRTGNVTSVEAFLPGDGHAVHLTKGAAIRAELMRPSSTAKLSYLVVATRATDDATATPFKPAQMAVTIDGAIDVTLRPVTWFARTEIAGKRTVPGPTITIRCVEGEIDLVYVVGRWDE
jgi:hypothetical protein